MKNKSQIISILLLCAFSLPNLAQAEKSQPAFSIRQIPASELKEFQRIELRSRLSALKAIKDKDPKDITDTDKEYLVKVATYFNFDQKYVAKEKEKRRLSQYATALFILTSAEIASLDLPEVSFDALTAVEAIGTAYFGHELSHLVSDVSELDLLVRRAEAEPDILSKIHEAIDIFWQYRNDNIAWRIILDWRELNALDSKIILAIIDELINHINEILQSKAEIAGYLAENRDRIAKEPLAEYFTRSETIRGECLSNLMRLRRLRENILQGKVDSWINVNESIQEALQPYQHLQEKGFLEIESHFDENLPHIYANPIRISYIWANLLTNAKDSIFAMKKEKGIVIIKTRTAQEDGQGFIEIVFSDNGQGIPEKLLSGRKLFHKGETTKPYGTGLGLYIVDQVVRKYGGKIEVESELGKGTTFTIRLPIAGPSLPQPQQNPSPSRAQQEVCP